MKGTVTWVVVADGARARIFTNNGPGKGLTAIPKGDFSVTHSPARDIAADRPGRTRRRPTRQGTALRSASDREA